MNYLKFGESKNFIVFLHGWGADLNSFLFAKDYFEDYSKVFVDFAGFGQSAEPAKAYYVKDYAEELRELLSKFDIDNLVLVGHSFGGRVAIKFSSLYQFDYDLFKVCLVDSAGLRPKLSLARRLKIFKYKKLKAKAQKNAKFREKLLQYGSNDYRQLSDVMKQTFVNIVNEDLSLEAGSMLCKTFIVWGEKDKETKIAMAKKFNKIILNSQLFVIKGAGHFCFLNNTQEFLIILDTLLKS